MEIFTSLLIALIVATILFYIVFLSLVYYWHETKTTLLVVPLIFTFDFFATGFFIIAIVSLLVEYLPEIINFFV